MATPFLVGRTVELSKLMFETMTWVSWLRLAAAVWLFLGPGYTLLSLYPDDKRLDRTQKAALTIALAISFWAIALAWLGLIQTRLTPLAVGIILAAGWVIGLARQQPWRSRGRPITFPQLDASRIFLWIVVITIGVIAVWSLRSVIVGPGSDSYHHTLITQLIVERGGLPSDYQPYAPLVTFTYHYGFHAFAAALVMLTDLAPVVVTPVLAQLLTAAAALSVAFFAQAATGSRLAAAASGIIAGLVAVFPAYLINWGRYTQLTGMVLLPVFLGLVWLWAKGGWKLSELMLVSVLAAGIALTHYRVALMTISGTIILFTVSELAHRLNWAKWQSILWLVFRRLILTGATAVALVMPWFWHLLNTRTVGYPIILGTVEPTFFSLSRFGPSVLQYPTNWLLIGLLTVAILLGLIWRDRLVIGLTVWGAIMLLLSTPHFASTFMDTVSVIISLYFPIAIIIGWMFVRVAEWLGRRVRVLRRVVWATLVGLAIWGAVPLYSILEPSAAYIWADDLPAIAWIQENTPPGAHFMVNTFHFDFSKNYIIAPDAGYWIPLLTGQATVTAPMTYPNERAAMPDFLSRLIAVGQLEGRLTSPEALATLQRNGVTHVYLGARGGAINPDELLNSSAFELLYFNGRAYVFRFR